MNDDMTNKLFDKVNTMSNDLSTIIANLESFWKLEHEVRIRTLENEVSKLVESVNHLVKVMDDRKGSVQYIVTTCLSSVAVLISVYAVIKR